MPNVYSKSKEQEMAGIDSQITHILAYKYHIETKTLGKAYQDRWMNGNLFVIACSIAMFG